VREGLLRGIGAVVAHDYAVRRAAARLACEHARGDDDDRDVRLVQERVRHAAERRAKRPESARADHDLLGVADFGQVDERARGGTFHELVADLHSRDDVSELLDKLAPVLAMQLEALLVVGGAAPLRRRAERVGDDQLAAGAGPLGRVGDGRPRDGRAVVAGDDAAGGGGVICRHGRSYRYGPHGGRSVTRP
jgi:hypothetical protein